MKWKTRPGRRQVNAALSLQAPPGWAPTKAIPLTVRNRDGGTTHTVMEDRDMGSTVKDAVAETFPDSTVAPANDDVQALIEAIPDRDAGEGDAWGRILGDLATAKTLDDLDAPWRSEGLMGFRDQLITVYGISKAPSEKPGGFGYYLLVDMTAEATQQRVTVTTSSTATMAQLVKAFHLGLFPAKFIVRRSEKMSRNGFYSWHLEVAR